MSLLRLMLERAEREGPPGGWSDNTPAAPPVVPDEAGPALYVATDLEHWERDSPGDEWHTWEDVERDGRVYRRLDPYYCAWLRHRMELARKAVRDRVVDPCAYRRLVERFRAIDAWARERFGAEPMARAESDLVPRTYTPPRATGHLYPPDGAWPFRKWVSAGTAARVDGIRDRAVALGWTDARLYQNRGRHPFPFGGNYGFVSFLRWDEEPGAVTAGWIEIVRAGAKEQPLRFYNSDAEQPWLVRSLPGHISDEVAPRST